jgi:hypothetical protein
MLDMSSLVQDSSFLEKGRRCSRNKHPPDAESRGCLFAKWMPHSEGVTQHKTHQSFYNYISCDTPILKEIIIIIWWNMLPTPAWRCPLDTLEIFCGCFMSMEQVGFLFSSLKALNCAFCTFGCGLLFGLWSFLFFSFLVPLLDVFPLFI